MFGHHGALRQCCRVIFLCFILGLSLAACGGRNTGSGSTPTPVPLKVTSVEITVGPSLDGHACGTQFTETYTATFHFLTNNAGGQVQFQYTTTNGRSSTPASLTVAAGQITATYQFSWSGQLPADHTAPGSGGVMVTSPNSLTSQMVAPSGFCTTVAPSVFQVTSVEISTSPTLDGHACGTPFTETYTATFHLAPGGSGGTIVFQYTTNNGRSSTNASLTVAAGQTTATYQFTWSGQLPADHTAPGNGGVMVSSPNALISPLVAPSGSCSTGTSSAFQVTKIDLSASSSLGGHACGTQFTETYIAVFHIVSGGPGGTIVFQYTTNNGRSNSPNISLHVLAGQTTVTYQFTWSGTLPADHTAPGIGIVTMSAPNQGESPQAIPSGSCS